MKCPLRVYSEGFDLECYRDDMPDWRVVKDELNSFIMDRYMEE